MSCSVLSTTKLPVQPLAITSAGMRVPGPHSSCGPGRPAGGTRDPTDRRTRRTLTTTIVSSAHVLFSIDLSTVHEVAAALGSLA